MYILVEVSVYISQNLTGSKNEYSIALYQVFLSGRSVKKGDRFAFDRNLAESGKCTFFKTPILRKYKLLNLCVYCICIKRTFNMQFQILQQRRTMFSHTYTCICAPPPPFHLNT